MKCLTILALLVAVCAVLLDAWQTEGREDDFKSLGDSMNDEEDL
jgi:alpha-galactosidase